MDKYKCEICGKKHNVFRALESPLPDLITDIPEEERERRIKEEDGICIVDEKQVLCNGYIYIEMENLDEPIFYWQVWVSVSAVSLQKNLSLLMNGQTVELTGSLESEIPFYPKSIGLEASVIIPASNESDIEVIINEESKLKEDQFKPISKERVTELMQHIYHRELFHERKVFNQLFSERLEKELINAEKQFLLRNKDFVINVSSFNKVLFQIVSNSLLESKGKSVEGFGLHLSFDPSFEELIEEIEKFKKQGYSKAFTYYMLDGIPTYQIDLGKNLRKINELVKRLIEDVYDQEIETIDLDSFDI